MDIRNCTPDDLDKIRLFVNNNKPLGLHTPFTYWVLLSYCSDTSFVMLDKNTIIGYTLGIVSSLKKGVFYLWQIGISQQYRGKKYSHLLLDKIIEAAKKHACSHIQFSIEPDNQVNYQNMCRYAKNNKIFMQKIGTIKYADTLSGKNENESLYEFLV